MGEEYIRRVMVLGEVPSLGPVIVFDDIEDLLKWAKGEGVGDSVFEKDITYAYNGSACLHMKTRTTDAAALDQIDAHRFVAERPGRRYRYEIFWRFPDRAKTLEVWFDSEIVGAGNIYRAGVQYLPNANVWAYQDAGGTFVQVPGSAQKLEPLGWHRLTFEFDLSKEKYIKMVSDGLEIDMKDLALYSVSSDLGHYMKVFVRLVTSGAAAAEMYFDDVLVMEI